MAHRQPLCVCFLFPLLILSTNSRLRFSLTTLCHFPTVDSFMRAEETRRRLVRSSRMIEVKPKHRLPILINKLDARFVTLCCPVRASVTAIVLGSIAEYPKTITHPIQPCQENRCGQSLAEQFNPARQTTARPGAWTQNSKTRSPSDHPRRTTTTTRRLFFWPVNHSSATGGLAA
jgi:hypothetical protein